MTATISGDLLKLLLNRRTKAYDPWADLARRTGIELLWHTGESGDLNKPWGLTNFQHLSISLLMGLNHAETRSTLTHELIHLERGPMRERRQDAEERAVELLTAKRLVDPLLYDALVEAYPSPTWRQIMTVLEVDECTFEAYAGWRSGVQDATARRVWAWEAPVEPRWPAVWLERAPDSFWYAARAAGVENAARGQR